MYRRSSQSTPRIRPGSAYPNSRKTTPLRKRDEDRPPWNDTAVGDTDKYKLTPEQLARKKQQRVSKNMVSMRVSNNGTEWGSGLKQPHHSSSPDARSEGHSPIPGTSNNNQRQSSGTLDGQPRRSETPSSPPINYAAVLQMLSRHREEGLHSPNSFSPGAEAASKPAAADPIPDSCNSSHVAMLQPDFDATMGGFSRLDISSGGVGAPPSSSTPPAAHPPASRAPGEAVSPVVAPAVNNYLSPSALEQGEGHRQHPPAPPLSLGAAMDSMWDQQRDMGSRISSLEAALAQHQGSTARADELHDLRATVQQLAADQARMRADLSNFSNHATQLMSTLQAQLSQLLLLGGQQGQSQPQEQQQQHHHHHQPSYLPQQQQHRQQEQQPQGPSSVQGLVPHLGNNTGGACSTGTLPPRRSLFTDISVFTTSPATSRPQGDIDDSHLALPSYAAMRRSAAGISTASPVNPAHPAPFPRPLVSPTPPHHYPTPSAPITSNPTTIPTTNNAWSSSTKPSPAASEVASSLASIHAPTHPPAMGLAPRIMPSSFQARALGEDLPSAVGDSGSYIGQGAAGAVAAAGGNLASLGIDLPAHRLGGPALGKMSIEGGSTGPSPSPRNDGIQSSHMGNSGGGQSGPIRGMPSSFGTHHPEPLLFDVASDFKIVRVGNPSTGKGGAPENSLSYAAHTAAAARQKEARTSRG